MSHQTVTGTKEEVHASSVGIVEEQMEIIKSLRTAEIWKLGSNISFGLRWKLYIRLGSIQTFQYFN